MKQYLRKIPSAKMAETVDRSGTSKEYDAFDKTNQYRPNLLLLLTLFCLFADPSYNSSSSNIQRVSKDDPLMSEEAPRPDQGANEAEAKKDRHDVHLKQNGTHVSLAEDPRPPVHVIIISRWRYGSSFTGDIFNNNPDFTYFYEPLRHKLYEGDEDNGQIHQDQIDMLRDLLKCEFTQKSYTWWDLQDTGLNCYRSLKFAGSILCKKQENVKKPSASKVKNEKRSRLLSRSRGTRLSASFSKDIRSQLSEELCQSSKHVAIKTVRVPDIKHLQSIVTDDSLNVKVIQLVRDLRGVYHSRKVMTSVCDMELTECDELKNNLKYWKDPPSWLKDKYMLLRYEDLADDPVQMVEIIYTFIGLPVPETVKLWLELNEKKMSSTGKSAYSWRGKIDYETMVNVQQYCMDTLLMAGYVPIKSEKDLTNSGIPSMRKFSYPLQPNMSTSTAAIRSRRKYPFRRVKPAR